ncbi:serine--tRNA ligase [Paenibacillus sp. MSJ-34]|uniref:serine--tRNA ligase n=1 Tax=Paenibacillus sp. MSJ-34 TaxID=2841529 RepID=UPI001C1251E4|nr:serine--tRNA ligase [Paenibacillus sp. MSJ-34]MBU5442716.1 serine--tRNA ligase [Paenibacillus sp. MSJ-34]
MLDIKWIRQHQETIQEVADWKGIDVSIPDLIAWDEQRRRLLQEAETLRNARNDLSQQISGLIREGKRDAAAEIKERAKENNRRLEELSSLLAEAERHYRRLMLLVPNCVSPDTPVGRSDADNVVVRTVGSPPCFDFEPKDHAALGEMHGIVDIARGVKVAGARNYFLVGSGFSLHRAVQQLALDLLASRGFTAMEVPLLVREDALTNAGFFPLGQDQTFELAADRKWLVGTSEVPLISYYGNEVVDVRHPMKLAAVSNCFRREIGSAGKDVRGLYRVHQFAKVEQVIVCANDPELSERLLQQITQNAEDLLQLLELPYRVVAVCTGDMSQKTYKQYDIETWMPSRQAYGETHSSSNLHDFQARRSNIKYRDENGELRFCHTLNNTAVATPRILIPLLEVHQRQDGSIHIPQALRKYMGGMKELTLP